MTGIHLSPSQVRDGFLHASTHLRFQNDITESLYEQRRLFKPHFALGRQGLVFLVADFAGTVPVAGPVDAGLGEGFDVVVELLEGVA